MPLADLHRFLVDAFVSNDGMVMFIAELDRRLLPRLPSSDVPRDVFAFRTLEVLRGGGYLDVEFFEALARWFARRAGEVARLAGQHLGSGQVGRVLRAAEGAPDVSPMDGPIPTTVELRILIVAANPIDRDPLALAEEARAIERALGGRAVRERVRVDSAWAVTANVLSGHLLRYRPHLLHYAGHGNRQGEPLLLGPNDEASAVSRETLQQLFRELEDLRCVVFNACHSVRLGQELVGDVRAVIGMRGALGDGSALAFATRFYESVAGHNSLRTAFNVAREAVAERDRNLPQLNTAPDVDADRVVLLPKRA